MTSDQLLASIAHILWTDGHDTEWDADTTAAIAELLQSQRPDLVPPESDCSHHPLAR